MTPTLTIEDAVVVTADDRGTVHERGWVHVVDNRIVGVGAGDAPASARRADEVIPCRGQAVMPGMVATPGTMEHSQEEAFNRVMGNQAIKKRVLPEHLAALIAFLASDDAELITGQIINVDGGFSMKLFREDTRPMASFGGGVTVDVLRHLTLDIGYRYSGIFIKTDYQQLPVPVSPHSHTRIDTHRLFAGAGFRF